MAWDKAYVNCGVVKVEGNIVRVYKDYASYMTITSPGKPVDARWAGDGIVVTLDNGKAVSLSKLLKTQSFDKVKFK